MQTGLYKEMIAVSQKITSDVNEKKNILKLLAYFDMFDHPISIEEIQFFLSCTISRNELENILYQLQEDRHLFRHGEFYSLRNDPLLTTKRLKGHALALPMLVAAHKGARFFSRFPYVRGIAISGSLSKNVAEEDADIDLFIITKANRLWVARTFMCLVIKIFFLIRKRRWYCLNYFVDDTALQIEEKNVFTAMEIITLIPAYDNDIIDNFYRANTWVSNYYQGYDKKTGAHKITASNRWTKKLLEYFFNNKFGNWLDGYLMKVTIRRWHKSGERGKLNSKGNQFGMNAGKHFSKPNPVFFQEKLLARYNEKISDLKLQMPEIFNDTNPSFEEL